MPDSHRLLSITPPRPCSQGLRQSHNLWRALFFVENGDPHSLLKVFCLKRANVKCPHLYNNSLQTFKSPSLCPFPFCFFLFSIPFFGRFFIKTSVPDFSDKTVPLEFSFQVPKCFFDVIIVNFYLHISLLFSTLKIGMQFLTRLTKIET